jgi:hypothetical protein
VRNRNGQALVAFLDERAATAHGYGRRANDCGSFALAAVAALTGEDPAPDLDWSNRREALMIVKRFGSLEAAFDAYFERIPPALAMRGDIAGVPDADFGIHPMVVEGDMLVGPDEGGTRRLKRSAMVTAWSAVIVKRQRKNAK